MAETNAGNFLSPEAVIMLPVAITLDAIGIVLVIFLLDDFFITDIVGFAVIGVWSWFRSQIKGDESAIEMPDREERKKQTQQTPKETEATKTTKAGKTAKTARSAKWVKWIRFLEFVPYLGVLPLWTISVFFELKE